MLGGGKFANGAVTSAFQHLFNAEGTRRFSAAIYQGDDFNKVNADTPDLERAAWRTAGTANSRSMRQPEDLAAALASLGSLDSLALYTHAAPDYLTLANGFVLTAVDLDMCKHAEGNWMSNFREPAPLGSLRVRQLAWWRTPVIPQAAEPGINLRDLQAERIGFFPRGKIPNRRIRVSGSIRISVSRL